MDMSSTFRDYALKKLSEAREKGATIANATAATISNTVPVTLPTSSSFSFRSNTPKHESKQNEWTLEKKVVVLSMYLHISKPRTIYLTIFDKT